MTKSATRKVFVIIPILTFCLFFSGNRTDEYVLIGWNDLGMHCANADFDTMCILPPYNNLIGHVIKRGSQKTLPEVMTGSIDVSFEIPGNTYSIGKTNFWDYVDDLFGVTLPDNIGLTGAGLSGNMETADNHFYIDGIPVTPFQDTNWFIEDPFQLALLQAFDNTRGLLASTQIVIPVSNEINCISSGCHSSLGDILNEHDDEGGFNTDNLPILCADCHSSNALGKPGLPGVPSFSEAIHDKHKEKTNDCYKCHPGPNTQCLRDVMHAAGMVCQDCHGSMTEVAESIKDGREPWLEEPSCGSASCHGSNYAEEPGKLFRLSKGHGNLYCSTCHGSPHAILPSTTPRDNIQNITLQGYQGTLDNCAVCHGYFPEEAGPHGLFAPARNLTLQDETISENTSVCYNAIDTIFVAGENTFFEVDDGGNLVLIAGKVIFLRPGFIAHQGSEFLGFITENNQFCSSMGYTLIPYSNPVTDENDPDLEDFVLHLAKSVENPDMLGDNFPNPFHYTTVIPISLTTDRHVVIEIYSLSGLKLMTLMDQNLEMGSYNIAADLSDFSPGVYLYGLNTGDSIVYRKMIRMQ